MMLRRKSACSIAALASTLLALLTAGCTGDGDPVGVADTRGTDRAIPRIEDSLDGRAEIESADVADEVDSLQAPETEVLTTEVEVEAPDVLDVEDVCMPMCEDKECGPDGCAGECGQCEGELAACQDGLCICIPACSDVECGPDGCGGYCPFCDTGWTCGEGQCNDCSDGALQFSDAALELAVAKELGKDEGPLDYEEVGDLQFVTAWSAGIKELHGVGCLPALASLDLRENSIADVEPLVECQSLLVLDLCDNLLTDVAPLASIPSLAQLFLLNNQLTDLTSLKNLSGIVELMVSGNQLQTLHGVSTMTSMIKLYAAANNITDISALAGLGGMFKLDLSHNEIVDISPLAGLESLEWLDLGHNQIVVASALAGLDNVGWLSVSNNSLDSFEFVEGMSSLNWLTLGGNDVTDLSPLVSLQNLEVLSLVGNYLEDISALASLQKLTVLELASNFFISDLSPLAGLLQLSEVHLSDNAIEDLSPLVLNPGIGEGDFVDLQGNLINCTEQADNIAELQARGVELLYDCFEW